MGRKIRVAAVDVYPWNQRRACDRRMSRDEARWCLLCDGVYLFVYRERWDEIYMWFLHIKTSEL